MRKSIVAASLALVLSSAFALPAFAQDGVIRIGATLRMISDEGEKIGQMLIDEFEQVNRAGGINGRRVQVTLMNDECKADRGVANATRLVSSNQVHLLVGSTCSAVSMPIVDITSRAGVPQISPSSTGGDITRRGSAWVFRVPIAERFYNGVIGRFVGDQVGLKVAYLWTTDNASQSFARGMINFMKTTYNVDPVFQAQATEQDVDFRSHLLRIRALNPDAIAFAGVPADLARMVSQANEVGIPASVIRVASSNAATAAFPDLAGEHARGVIYSGAFTAFDTRPEVQRFVAEMTRRYNVSRPDHDFSQAYDMIQIIKQALGSARLTLTSSSLAADRQAIRDALAATRDFRGLAAGPINFCPESTPQCRDGNRSPILIEFVKGGKDFESKVRTAINFDANFGL